MAIHKLNFDRSTNFSSVESFDYLKVDESYISILLVTDGWSAVVCDSTAGLMRSQLVCHVDNLPLNDI